MKKKLILAVLLLAGGVFLCTVPPVQAYLLSSFEYNGVNYGTMDISVSDRDSLLIKFTLNSPLPGTAKVAGFGFNFDSVPSSVSNPTGGAYTNDLDAVNWYKLTNLSPLPNPTNDPMVKKNDFNYGVTTESKGNNINQSGPAIGEGNFDYFILDFSGGVDFLGRGQPGLGEYGSGFVNLVGVRVQGLSNDVNGGSLFLVPVVQGAPVPEPATMLLLGSGLVGLAGFGRRKFFKKA